MAVIAIKVPIKTNVMLPITHLLSTIHAAWGPSIYENMAVA